MFVTKINEEVCKKLGILVDENKKLPSDEEMDKLFDIFFGNSIFDDESEVITAKSAFAYGNIIALYPHT